MRKGVTFSDGTVLNAEAVKWNLDHYLEVGAKVQALLSSIPVPDTDVKPNRIILQGEVPSPYHPPEGCHFHTRCPYATEQCRTTAPEMRDAGNGHMVACHRCAAAQG